MLLRNIWSDTGMGRIEPVLLAVVACSCAEAAIDRESVAATAASESKGFMWLSLNRIYVETTDITPAVPFVLLVFEPLNAKAFKSAAR